MRAWSCFTLFLDLTKAFDKAWREVAMGWMQGVDASNRAAREAAAAQASLPPEVATRLAHFIETERPALAQAGVSPHVLEMVRSLHTGAWFRVGSLDSVIVSKLGGRQGCKLGSIVFNVVYAVALNRLRTWMREAGVILVVKVNGSSPFWASDAASAPPSLESHGAAADNEHEVVEVTYVDDETVMLASASPGKLLAASRRLMTELCAIFVALGLKVNFAKGKTEALLTLRGKKSRALNEKLRQPDGTRLLRLPNAPGSPALRLVDSYKHLGSTICEDRSLVPEGISRASSALNAFGPIAATVLGTN